jgi:hypothetical protein
MAWKRKKRAGRKECAVRMLFGQFIRDIELARESALKIIRANGH